MAQTEKTGRMTKWVIKLGEHDISYRPRTTSRGQILADFIAEVPEEEIAAINSSAEELPYAEP